MIPAFPDNLLNASVGERIDYFKNTVLGHRNLSQITEAVFKKVKYPDEEKLFLVIGAGAVGKTTMGKLLGKFVLEEYADEMDKDKGIIPFSMMETSSSVRGYFDWADHFERQLEELLEPIPARDPRYAIPEFVQDKNGKLIPKKEPQLRRLRRSYEKCLKYRKVRINVWDEAPNILKLSSGKKLLDQMDCIKSLVNLTNTSICLLGGYDLLNIIGLSPQLTRRTKLFHFERYDNTKTDLKVFRNIINSFETHMPLSKPSNLVHHVDYLWEYSLGCVGLLKPWLFRALKEALLLSKNSVSLEELEDTETPAYVLNDIANEIYEGEEAYKILLETISQERESIISGEESEKQNTENNNGNSSKKTKPGERKPTRDPVGS